MGAVLRFIAWLAGQIRRYGARVISAVTNWAKRNWRNVVDSINVYNAFAPVVDWIRRKIGI